MKSYKLIHELLNLVEKLEGESMGMEVTLHDFAGFLINNLDGPIDNTVNLDLRFGKNENFAQQLAYQLDNNIGRLFIYMSRYAKSYIKKALEGTPLQTAEDFTCMAILLTHDDLSKSDLINRNLQEKTSGIEVIKRLIAAGLVEQWDDANDKRGKRIGITNKGRELLYVVFGDMNRVGKMITGTLTVTEKLNLQYLLQKLEFFHHQHYQNKTIAKKADLEAFIQKAG
jgi:DNA-binding MarR family transcriptional regulator